MIRYQRRMLRVLLYCVDTIVQRSTYDKKLNEFNLLYHTGDQKKWKYKNKTRPQEVDEEYMKGTSGIQSKQCCSHTIMIVKATDTRTNLDVFFLLTCDNMSMYEFVEKIAW